MSILLSNYRYLMGNCVGLSNLKVLFCQWKVWDRIFLQLDLKLELGPPVSTLGGCAGLTLGDDTGKSRRMMSGPEWDMWTLRWISVELLPSSYSMMLGRSEGIGLARVGRIWWGRGAYLVTGCFCGGSNDWCRLAATLEKMSESLSIAIIWESLISEDGAWGAGFCRAWANLCSAMMTFSEEEL